MEDLQKWAKEKYFTLMSLFEDKQFTLKEAEEGLKRLGIEPGNVKVLMSELQKAGLVKTSKYALDERYTLYQLVPLQLSSIDKKSLETFAKTVADLIRVSVDYKVIPLFVFYKTVSDMYMKKVNEYKQQGFNDEDAYLLVNNEFFKLYDDQNKKLLTWGEITKSKDTLQDMATAIKRIAEMNGAGVNEALTKVQNLVDIVGLNGFLTPANSSILINIIKEFNKIDFSQADFDIIGDTYQWVLRYFAPQKAKEGEVYTPLEVVDLMVKLLDIEDNTTVLDPAVGSGAMLIKAYRYVREKINREPRIMLYGQDRNEITAALAEMNLILNNITNHKIYIGDSLTNPRFEQADYVLANPPWNLDGYGDEVLEKDPKLRKIYHYGYPPNNTADWAWVQLMLYYAKRKIGIVLDQGALFRKNKEKAIREKIVKDDLIEAIILLPEKLFYNTSASGVIVVLNKQKSPERKGKILFIQASQEYKKHPEVRKLNILTEKNIEKIVQIYREYKEIPGFSKIVSMEEIKNKDYNLNVNLYVTLEDQDEKIDMEKEYDELLQLENETQQVLKEIKGYIEEINKVNKDGQ